MRVAFGAIDGSLCSGYVRFRAKSIGAYVQSCDGGEDPGGAQETAGTGLRLSSVHTVWFKAWSEPFATVTDGMTVRPR